MEKDAYYFPHFSNARHDRKIKRIRKQLGIEGYGIYFMLLETLREQPDYKYPLTDVDLLADEYGTSEQKINAIISGYGLFNLDEVNNFFSPKLIEYLQPWEELKEKRRLAGIKSGDARRAKSMELKELQPPGQGENRASVQQVLNKCSASVELRKEMKVKEKKEEEKKYTKKEIPITHPLQIYIKDNLPNVSKLKTQITAEQCEKLISKYDKKLIQSILGQMENSKQLTTKYQSVYLTCNNWCERHLEQSNANSKPGAQPVTDYAKRRALTVDDIAESLSKYDCGDSLIANLPD